MDLQQTVNITFADEMLLSFLLEPERDKKAFYQHYSRKVFVHIWKLNFKKI